MKRLTGVLILVVLLLFCSVGVSALDETKIQYNNVIYSIEGALETDVAATLPFSIERSTDGLLLTDKVTGITASIFITNLDDDSLEVLRNYYNDATSTDSQIFDKFVKLKKSYIPATLELYRLSFLYGESGDATAESNMKVFSDKSDIVFGQEANVYLYNIINTDVNGSEEKTHLDLIIPVPSDFSVISIYFTLEKGNLDADADRAISGILSHLNFEGLATQQNKLTVLKDSAAVGFANAGVYPAITSDNIRVSEYKDDIAGFTIKYPSIYTPYMENSIGGRLTSKSFKIDADTIFSVVSEPIGKSDSADGDYDPVKEKIALNKAIVPMPITVTTDKTISISGRDFYCFEYTTSMSSGTVSQKHYTLQYYVVNDDRLYCLELRSRSNSPSDALLKQFRQIALSLAFTENPANAGAVDAGVAETISSDFTEYLNNEEGYSFRYPLNWSLKDISRDINFDVLKLDMPELSAYASIYTTEGELEPGLERDEIISGITGTSTPEMQTIIGKYNPPFLNTKTKLLALSTRNDGDVLYIYRLLDYLDTSERNKLCYAVDAVKGKKIYSMFVSVSEYAATDGTITNSAMNNNITEIVSSFHVEDTALSKTRQLDGETRNRKVITLEMIMRAFLGDDAKVTSVTNTASDGSLYITVDDVPDSGYYKVLPDFKKNSFSILDKTLKVDILAAEIQKVYMNSAGATINSISLNMDNMSFSFVTSNPDQISQTSKDYKIDVAFTEKGVSWDTAFDQHASFLRTKFKDYVKTIFPSETKVYYAKEDEFKDIENYRKNNCNYYTAVYFSINATEFSFTLQVNPWNDDIRIIDFKSSKDMADEINAIFHGRDGSNLFSEYYFDAESQIISIYYESYKDGSEGLIEENYKVKFNPETMELTYTKM